jgi:hypothetical protein
MNKVLEKSSLANMAKLLQSIKQEKSVTPHLEKVKMLFYGKLKNVKVDPRFLEKKECIEALANILPHSLKSEFNNYFIELYKVD